MKLFDKSWIDEDWLSKFPDVSHLQINTGPKSLLFCTKNTLLRVMVYVQRGSDMDKRE